MRKNLMHLLAVSSLIVLAACTASAPTPDDSDAMTGSSTSSSSLMENEDDEMMPASSISSLPSAVSSSPAPSDQTPHLIQIHMKNWEFTPMTVTVRKGENVRLQLIGDEGIHGFAVPDLNLNVRVEAGETVTVDLDTSVAGTFEGFCSIPCGAGHKEMKVTIVVTE